MIINCNFCRANAKGTQAELQDKGWSRIVIFTPVRKTITACPLHHEEAGNKMLEVLPGRFKTRK
jgi:hypothetical protein